MSRRPVNQPLDEGCYYDSVPSPLGNIYLVLLESHLINVSFLRPHCRKGICPERIKAQFESYFKGDLRKFDLKMELISGTTFERAVWMSLKKIGYGETRSYKWLAEEINRPKAARAVGNALTKNPLPFLLHNMILLYEDKTTFRSIVQMPF